jgi:hypothetical protein
MTRRHVADVPFMATARGRDADLPEALSAENNKGGRDVPGLLLVVLLPGPL